LENSFAMLFSSCLICKKEVGYEKQKQLAIMHQILESARRSSSSSARNGVGATKTKLMYSSYLSSVQLKGYLRVLTEKSLA
jgi:predicted transcriptional regulator